MTDPSNLRNDFPNLKTLVNGHPVVYLDNAATTFKPQSVIDAINDYYTNYTSNVHRGLHSMSEQATSAFESSREKTQKFLNAKSSDEIIFTSGTTDSINLVAHCFGQQFLNPGDQILITEMEHHSNIVPWQIICEQKGTELKVLPFNDKGELRLDLLDDLLTDKTRLMALTHISNSLGTINPIEIIIKKAHVKNIPVLIDAAQSISHTRLDVQQLDCDFLAFSGHKLFGPTGIGVLYGKKKWLDVLPPYKGGGDMIENVTFEKTTYAPIPGKFEAGTPNIAGAIGLGAAIDYVQALNLTTLAEHKNRLLQLATAELSCVPGLRLIGTATDKTSVISFIIDEIHAHDLGTLLNEEGVAVRTGHHCTMPVMAHFGVTATTRASLSIYTTRQDIENFLTALNKARALF